VEASDDDNLIFLNFKEDSVRKTPHPGSPSRSVNNLKLRWPFGDYIHRHVDGLRKTLAKFWPYICIPITSID